MTVNRYKARDGVERWRYDFSYQVNGKKRHAERRGFLTKREALEAESRRRAEMTATDGATVGDGTTGDYLRHWLRRYAESGSRKPSSVAHVEGNVTRYLIPLLGDKRLSRLTVDDVQDAATQLHKRGGHGGRPLSPKTVANVIGTLRKALTDAVRWRLLSHNPATHVEVPRAEKYEGDAYDAAEIGVLLAYLSRHDDPTVSILDHALIRTLFTTGLRRGELLGLRWHNVDLVERRLSVRRTRVVVEGTVLDGDPKTAAGRRTIRFDAETGDALARLRNAAEAFAGKAGTKVGDDDLIATTFDGQPVHPLTFSRRFQRHAQRAGLRKIRLHDTRASHVQASVASGVDIVTVSRRVGHARTSFTLDLYGRVLASHDDRAADVVGAMLTDATREAETSYLLRTLRTGTGGNEAPDRTSPDVEPLENQENTTRDDPAREATPGIEAPDESPG